LVRVSWFHTLEFPYFLPFFFLSSFLPSFFAAAARALIDQPNVTAAFIAQKAMNIAADMCVFTNHTFVIETMSTTSVDAANGGKDGAPGKSVMNASSGASAGGGNTGTSSTAAATTAVLASTAATPMAAVTVAPTMSAARFAQLQDMI
jgi:hypothetical protein